MGKGNRYMGHLTFTVNYVSCNNTYNLFRSLEWSNLLIGITEFAGKKNKTHT